MKTNGRLVPAMMSVLMLPLMMSHVKAAVTPEEAREIGGEAFVYTYPLVLMDITRRASIKFEAGALPPASGP